MKVCVQCRWHKLPPDLVPYAGRLDETRLSLFSLCDHPDNPDTRTTSHITGQVTGQHPPYCSTLRSYAERCGPDGKLWEPKLAETLLSD